jgi:hypothetical protein
MTTANTTWVEFQLSGKFDEHKYRTNANASIVQFWSVEKLNWKTTKSATVQMLAIKELKKAKTTTPWTHNAPYNPQFLGAQPAKAGQDY